MNPPTHVRRERAIRWRRQWHMVRSNTATAPHPLTLTYYHVARAAWYRAKEAERCSWA